MTNITLPPIHTVIHFDNTPSVEGWENETIETKRAISVLKNHDVQHEIINNDLYAVEVFGKDGSWYQQPVKIQGCTYGDLFAWLGY